MYIALAIPELRDQVIGMCGPDRSSLASLARTCRSFLEPSLIQLYGSHKIDVQNLVKGRFPRGIRANHNDDHERKYFYFPSMDNDTWQRFDYYASKVKHLSISDAKFLDYYSAFSMRTQVCSRNSPNTPLFPKLESLSVGLAIPKCRNPISSCFLPFLSHTIRRLYLDVLSCNTYNELKPLRSVLMHLCPNIDTLHLSHNCDILDEEESAPLAGLFLRSENWKDVRIKLSTIHNVILIHLLSLDNLRTLSLDFDFLESKTKPNDFILKVADKQPLRKLDVKLDTSEAENFFEIVRLRRLEELSLELKDFQNFEEWNRTVDSLMATNKPLYVEILSINVAPDFIVDHCHFFRIFALEYLQELSLSKAVFEFTDDDILELAPSLKQLTTLHLPEHDSGLSLKTLVYLSVHCTHLVELSMYLQEYRVPEISEEELRQNSNFVFKRLVLDEFSALVLDERDTDGRIAHFIRIIFPTIQTVNAVSIDQYLVSDNV